MDISVFDLFKIGIGPSSSHTVGPMRAAARFLRDVEARGALAEISTVEVDLYGSLALTGKGHGTDRAILLGLMGEDPETVDPDAVEAAIARLAATQRLALLGCHEIVFDQARHLRFNFTQSLPAHANALRLVARHETAVIDEAVFYSVGGGFIVKEGDASIAGRAAIAVPHAFISAADLLSRADAAGLSIAALVRANERAWRDDRQINEGLARIRAAMRACVDRGLAREGTLPGGLNVRRRAPGLYQRLRQRQGANNPLPHEAMDWVSTFAIAVNEENAAGGRVVTAPTNGAAGIVPAVLRYYEDHCGGAEDGADVFLLTAAAIGMLAKRNASISGAEVGCQGEVGVAAAMAAAGLAAALGGNNAQVENAAEIAIEHHLGMTCDPIGGLVQIPCIERNAMGAIKAINAASLALAGDGSHKVSLDQVIETMRQTGADMQSKYKETAQGGLAVNVVEC